MLYNVRSNQGFKLLENVHSNIYIPLDRQAVAFLEDSENGLKVVSVNLVYAQTKVLKQLQEDGKSYPVYHEFFKKHDGRVSFRFQRKSGKEAEFHEVEIPV